MRRILVLILLFLPVVVGAQPKLQIISINKDANTFVRSANGDWAPADIHTSIDENTVFKNYSDPPSRIIIRDWERNVQYSIKLSQQEFSLSIAIKADVNASEPSNGKILPFVIKAIREQQVPALHYSRSSAAISQRGTKDGEELRQAAAALSSLVAADRRFRIDSLSSLDPIFPVGLRRSGEDAIVLTNYSEEKTLYLSVYRIAARKNGRISAESIFGNNQYVLPPMTETLVPAANKGRLVMIAAEEELSPAAVSIKLERMEGARPDGREIIPATAVLLD